MLAWYSPSTGTFIRASNQQLNGSAEILHDIFQPWKQQTQHYPVFLLHKLSKQGDTTGTTSVRVKNTLARPGTTVTNVLSSHFRILIEFYPLFILS